MPHVLIAGKIHQSGLELLSKSSQFTFKYVEELTEKSYKPFITNADALIIRTQALTENTIKQARKLKIVSRHGVGYDNIDLKALNKRNIPLTIVGDVNSRTVAEHTMMLLLATARRLLRYDKACREKDSWAYRDKLEAREVFNKELLIIGYGKIGKHVARMATSFGINVSIFDPYLLEEIDIETIKVFQKLEDGLKNADFVSLHCPRMVFPIIGVNEIKLLKPGAIILNVARGGLIDDEALVRALRQGRLGGAGIDVLPDEPPIPHHIYKDIDTAVLTPHSASLSLECAERMAQVSVKNVISHFYGKIDRSLIANNQNLSLEDTHYVDTIGRL